MPEPAPRTPGFPVPLWPDTLPGPQETSFTVMGPQRAEYSDVLTGPTARAGDGTHRAGRVFVFLHLYARSNLKFSRRGI